MEPLSLSLLAISASSVALRRATAEDVPADFPAHRIDQQPRTSVLSVLAAGLKIRRLFASDQSEMLHALARFAATEGLRIDMQVSLAAMFDEGEDDWSSVANALRQRKIDVLISDMDGTPLCGVELPAGRGPAHRDAVRRMAFSGAGLPLISLLDHSDWALCRAKLIEALKFDEDDLEESADEDDTAIVPAA